MEEVPAGYGPTVVSVGNFDGVHQAHRNVLRQVVRRAGELEAKPVAVTFEPHPARILRPNSGLKLLTPTPEKLRLLDETGVDAVLLLPFGRDLSLMSAAEFAECVLKKTLGAREIHEGFNFRFGHRAEGTIATLKDLGKQIRLARVALQVRIRAAQSGSCCAMGESAGQGICWDDRSAFCRRRGEDEGTVRSTQCRPST